MQFIAVFTNPARHDMIVPYPAAQTESQRALSQCPKTGVVKEAYRRQMMILFYSCMIALQGALFAVLTFICGIHLYLLPDAGSRLYPGRQHHPGEHCVGISGHHPLGSIHAAVADVRRELFCPGRHSGPYGHYRLDAFPGSGQLCRAGVFSPHPDLSLKPAGQIRITVWRHKTPAGKGACLCWREFALRGVRKRETAKIFNRLIAGNALLHYN